MMTTLEDFHDDLIQTTLSIADSRGLLNSQAFFEYVCEELSSTGELSVNYSEADIRILKGRNPVEAYGYDFDDERGVLSILTHEFFQEDQIQTLTLDAIDKKIKRLKNFLIRCMDGFFKELEETSPAYSMAYQIYCRLKDKEINKVKFFLLTDGQISKNFKGKKLDEIDGISDLELRIVDVDYLFKNYSSKNVDTTFAVDVKIPYLKIPSDSQVYTSYLTYLSGDQLFEIYDQYGKRLLEQNVRTFLQFKGSVNKGIRNTISGAPSNFFAFNNGITATASRILIEDDHIVKLFDFQIVNGGQTTSSIYAAKKKEGLDVSQVSVQMKLSVIEAGEEHSEFVSRVAEYANTQNKVNKSDFFSNSPFHKDMKKYSSHTWVNPINGSQKKTRWYYERVRGEFLNEQIYLSKSKQKQFLLENPKNQLIDKTFLAKSESSWLQKPHIVSRGAQYCFSDFATYISELLEKNNLAITEKYFQDAVSKIILFRTIERMISNSDWYTGGYRAQTVTYTISYLAHYIADSKQNFNFKIIWDEQAVDNDLFEEIEKIAKRIHFEIIKPPTGYSNISQWCKKEGCWTLIKDLKIDLNVPKRFYKNQEEVKYEKRQEKSLKKVDSIIEIQTFIFELPKDQWKQIFNYCSKVENRKGISSFAFTALSKFSNTEGYFPTENQCVELYKIYKRVVEEERLILK